MESVLACAEDELEEAERKQRDLEVSHSWMADWNTILLAQYISGRCNCQLFPNVVEYIKRLMDRWTY